MTAKTLQPTAMIHRKRRCFPMRLMATAAVTPSVDAGSACRQASRTIVVEDPSAGAAPADAALWTYRVGER